MNVYINKKQRDIIWAALKQYVEDQGEALSDKESKEIDAAVDRMGCAPLNADWGRDE